jgi:hypothetical protein
MAIYESEKDPLNPAGLIKRHKEGLNNQSNFNFHKGVVKEVISNPIKWMMQPTSKGGPTNKEFYIKQSKISNRNNTNVQNAYLLEYMPSNSILFYYSDIKGDKQANNQCLIAFPFFSSHMAVPIKPGEVVWLLKESTSGGEFFYYMNRISGIRQVEDVNYTHFARTENAILSKTYSEQAVKKVNTDNFETLATSFIGEKNIPLPVNLTFDRLHANSSAYINEFTGEPVPNANKQSGDLLLQGSNNSCLHLGSEKFLKLSDFSHKREEGLSINARKNKIPRKPFAGSVDLFCGNNKSLIRNIKTTGTTSDLIAKGLRTEFKDLEYLEINKLSDEETFSDSPRNVFARLYMSMDASIDAAFNMPTEFSHHRGASIVNYADHVRIIAENSLRLSNLSFTNMIDISNDGSITLQAGSGEAASKIILKSDGNIIIKPGSNGVIRLGGDENDEMVAACGVPYSQNQGQIEGDPIVTTLGGELFRNNLFESDIVADVRQTINTVAANAGPSLNVAGPGAAVAAAQAISFPHTDPDYFPGEPAPDGFSSSKVLIRK